MPTREFDAPLDDAGLEWIRYRFTTEGGQVTAFAIQYETTVADRRMPVVRYDGAHDFAHRDLLNRAGGLVEKLPLAGDPSFREALQIGERDIRANWPRYRRNFLGDQS